MSAWFESLVGPEYATPAMWIVTGLVLLILLLLLARLLRGLASGTFVAGGRNRRARLAVMDAAAVDTNRRLVLVRRDDVEHLLLIGGPTDLVIEQNIRMITPGRRHTDAEPEAPPARQPAAPVQESQPQQAAEPPRPRLVSPPPAAARPVAPTAPAPTTRDAAPPVKPTVAVAPPPPATQVEPAAFVPQPEAPTRPPAPPRDLRVEPAPVNAPRAPEPESARREPPPLRPDPAEERGVVTPLPVQSDARKPSAPSLDDADADPMLRDLEVTLDTPRRKDEDAGADEISLEEEMSRLLGDLSGDRRN